jgi:hypothetical protein
VLLRTAKEDAVFESHREHLIGAGELVEVTDQPVRNSGLRRAHGEQPVDTLLSTPCGDLPATVMNVDPAE